MKSCVKQWLLRGAVGVAILYASLSLTGVLLLSRSAAPSVSEADIVKLAGRPIEVRWSEVIATMETAAPANTPLTWAELACARKLVDVALTAEPDEWEGRDAVRASLGTVQYLLLLYPELHMEVVRISGGSHESLRLGRVRQVISSRDPQYWLVPLMELSRWLNPAP